MVLPDRYRNLRYSLLNGGAVILNVLGENDTVSSLREKTRDTEPLRGYDKFIPSLDLLYLLGAIEFRDGLIARLV
jgi:hypothetical protein